LNLDDLKNSLASSDLLSNLMFAGLPSWQVGFSMNLLMALSTESPLAVLGSCGS